MFNPDEIMLNALRIGEEFKAQKAEGRRRQRAYEGIPERENFFLSRGDGSKAGLKVGSRKLPGAGKPSTEGLEAASEFVDEGFQLYTPTDKDRKGLESELRDLERDLDSFEKSDTVRFNMESE